MRKRQLLFQLIRSVVCDGVLSESEVDALSPETILEVYELAERMDLAHLVGEGLSKLSLPESEGLQKSKKKAVEALYRSLRLEKESRKIYGVLEQNRIPYLPLKGAHLRKLYPQTWMRTSCDLDVLVKKEDLARAASRLVETLSYTHKTTTSHDAVLLAPNGHRLELHYDTIEDSISPANQEVLSKVWDVAVLKREGFFEYEMPDELFYFYHVAHMAKHFVNGGCGVRPFLDLWLLDRMENADRKKRDALLARGGLTSFANAARTLSRVWFSGEEADEISRKTEDFLFQGGTYGTMDNYVSIHRSKKKNGVSYLMSRVVLPYDVIKFHYPVLQTKKWLTPFYQVKRWWKLIFGKRRGEVLAELEKNSALPEKEIQQTKELLNHLGL